MLQLPVTKQGRVSINNFDDRVATFDSAQQSVFLSRKKRPEDLCRHKLIVTEVRLFPEYSLQSIGASMDSREAMLSLQIKGLEVPVTAEDRQRVTDCMEKGDRRHHNVYFPTSDTPLGSQPASRCSRLRTPNTSGILSSSSEMLTPSSAASVSPNGSTPTSEKALGKQQAWVLRCTTFDALSKLVDAFRVLQQPASSRSPSPEAVVNSPVSSSDGVSVCAGGPSIVGSLDTVRESLVRYDQRWNLGY